MTAVADRPRLGAVGLLRALAPVAVDLYWLPLGAGAPSGSHLVGLAGKMYEALSAAVELTAAARPLPRRSRDSTGRRMLRHRGRPVTGRPWGEPRGRCRRPRRHPFCRRPAALSLRNPLLVQRPHRGCRRGSRESDPAHRRTGVIARRLLELGPEAPTPVWGRDELRAGDMWNSNSVISWLLARAGLPVQDVSLPPDGRAPGWEAGIVVARRAR